MKRFPMQSLDGPDWCHHCGKRTGPLVGFTDPKNAEHRTDDGDGGYHRYCAECVTEMASLIEETQSVVPVPDGQ